MHSFSFDNNFCGRTDILFDKLHLTLVILQVKFDLQKYISLRIFVFDESQFKFHQTQTENASTV